MKIIVKYISYLGACFILISCGTNSNSSTQSQYPSTLNKEVLHEINNGQRNGEGAFILTSDNTLSYVYTCFNSGSNDTSSSDICIIRSKDEDRREWSNPKILIENHGIQNIMSVSLLRLSNDTILIQYLEKNSCNDLKVIRRYSFNELETVSTSSLLDINDGYNVVNNDRLLYYDNKVYTPISRHSCIDEKFAYAGIMELAITRDQDNTEVTSIDINDLNITFQEPGIVGLNKGGKMLMWFRNSTNKMFISLSNNFGKSFTKPKKTIINTVPYSPSSIKSFNNDLFIIYNKWSEKSKDKNRTPLILAISEDNLSSIGREYILEEDKEFEYMYTSIYKYKNDLFLAYMVQKKRSFFVRIVRVNKIFGK